MVVAHCTEGWIRNSLANLESRKDIEVELLGLLGRHSMICLQNFLILLWLDHSPEVTPRICGSGGWRTFWRTVLSR